MAEEKERSRIAQDLHDGVSPILSTIKLFTQTLSKPGAFSNQEKLHKKKFKACSQEFQERVINEHNN